MRQCPAACADHSPGAPPPPHSPLSPQSCGRRSACPVCPPGRREALRPQRPRRDELRPLHVSPAWDGQVHPVRSESQLELPDPHSGAALQTGDDRGGGREEVGGGDLPARHEEHVVGEILHESSEGRVVVVETVGLRTGRPVQRKSITVRHVTSEQY